MTQGPAVAASGLMLGYRGRVAVNGLTLEVARGELFGLAGANGSGKSTFLAALCGMLEPAAGELRVLGQAMPARADAVRARLGVAFQHASLDKFLTVRENLVTVGRLFGMGGSRLDGAVGTALARAGLADRADDRAGTLSGGLARRAELARALLHDPELLLLDEPSASLDPDARREFWDRLNLLRRGSALTIIVATHDLDEAARCDRVAVLDEGRLLALDVPGTLRGRAVARPPGLEDLVAGLKGGAA